MYLHIVKLSIEWLNVLYYNGMNKGCQMADIYTYMQWNYNLLSSNIVEKIEPKELYSMYYPLHETSIENGVEKLKKRYKL